MIVNQGVMKMNIRNTDAAQKRLHTICYRRLNIYLQSLNPRCSENLESPYSWIGLSTSPIAKYIPQNLNQQNLDQNEKNNEKNEFNNPKDKIFFKQEIYKGWFNGNLHPEAVIYNESDKILKLAKLIQDRKVDKIKKWIHLTLFGQLKNVNKNIKIKKYKFVCLASETYILKNIVP
jgi:hypothetical protein